MNRALPVIVCAPLIAAVVVGAPVAAGCATSFVLDTGGAYLVSNPDWGGTAGGDGSCGSYGCYASQSDPPISPDFLGFFWALGSGDPLVGSGDDNGAFSSDLWTKQVSRLFDQLYHYPAWLTLPIGENYLAGPAPDWSQAGDGCVLNAGATADLDGTECTAVLLADQFSDLLSNSGYFAYLTARVDASGRFPLPVSSALPIRLSPISKPLITASFVSTATLTAPPVPQAGLYLDPACGATSAVGYRLYIQHVPYGAEPADRRRDDGDPVTGWRLAVGGATATGEPIPLDQPALVSIACPPEPPKDAFLAASFVFDSGFETPYLSANSTRIHCIPCRSTDADGDGFCADPIDGAAADCDDADATVHPGAIQVCDGIHNDCGSPSWPAVPVDEADADGDAYRSCEGDCDDSDATVRPNAVELCNAVDDDCNGLVDEDVQGEDTDGDGVHGLCDNCPFAHNPLQTDLDGDLEGDLCDLDDGMIYIRFEGRENVEWQAETGFGSWNSYRGDLAVLRGGGPYTQLPGSNALASRQCGLTNPRAFDGDDPGTDQAAYFLTTGAFLGESSLGTDSAGNVRPNANPCP